MRQLTIEAMTPVGMDEALPQGTDLVQVASRWYLILWSDDCALAGPDADGYISLPLGRDVEPYTPPNIYVRDLIEELATESE